MSRWVYMKVFPLFFSFLFFCLDFFDFFFPSRAGWCRKVTELVSARNISGFTSLFNIGGFCQMCVVKTWRGGGSLMTAYTYQW